jgi:hypothetical protein
VTEVSSSIRLAVGLLTARVRSVGRVNLALDVVLLLSGGFYLWTAGTSVPLSLHGGLGDRYNLLASALLHLHLSIGPAPPAIMHLADPYNPEQHPGGFLLGVNDASSINDDVLYHGQLYFIWGPAPALVLLAPLHLLGFEPSASVTVAVFAIAGLGFALATLRVLLRQIGDIPMWTCVLAGFALSLSSAVPFILRTPSVTEDVLAGGFCFTMAGIWLATSVLVSRKASWLRLVLMSLCFGLAAGSRPTLALTALVLVPVYLSLRLSRSRRALLMSLALPVCVCFALLMAYNQARFDNPLQIGSNYQLTEYDSRTAPFGHLSYVLPGLGFYAITPPRPTILFPFIVLRTPQASLGEGVAAPEVTGGLLPMAPIVVFLATLPWIWRRRPELLGRLAAPLLILAGAGIAMALWASYELYASTERYEVDFATLLVLGGLAAWLSLSKGAPGLSKGVPGHRRRLLRVGGGLLAAWGCATGLAISFIGYGKTVALTHPGTWKALEDIGSPISTAIAIAVGHPVLAAVAVPAGSITEAAPGSDTGTPGSPNPLVRVTGFTLSAGEQAGFTIVSPDARRAALRASVELQPRTRYDVRIQGPGGASYNYQLPRSGGPVEMPVLLHRGLNRLTLSPVATSASNLAPTTPVTFRDLSVARAQ